MENRNILQCNYNHSKSKKKCTQAFWKCMNESTLSERSMEQFLIKVIVTNITLTGSSMVNWSRGLLMGGGGVTTVIMVSISALGYCFGRSVFKEGSRSPKYCKQIRFGWEVETLVYSDESRCLHRRWLGSATSRPCTTGTYWRCSQCISIHRDYNCHIQVMQALWRCTYMQYKCIRYRYTKDRLHQATPWNEWAFRFTVCWWCVRPT